MSFSYQNFKGIKAYQVPVLTTATGEAAVRVVVYDGRHCGEANRKSRLTLRVVRS